MNGPILVALGITVILPFANDPQLETKLVVKDGAVAALTVTLLVT